MRILFLVFSAPRRLGGEESPGKFFRVPVKKSLTHNFAVRTFVF